MFSVRKAAQAARHAAEAVRAPALARMKSGGRVVLVEGQRTPFAMSGTIFKDLIAQDLGRMAIKGLLTKTALDPADVDYVTYGTVIQEVRTSNVARESALAAGIPNKTPAHTVTLACISSNVALATAAEKILTGKAKAVVAGGTETMSDVPIRFSRPMRERLIKASKMKSPKQALPLLKGFKLGWLAPEAPAIAEFSTGEVMGHSSDRLAARFGITRKQQDEYALRSHLAAAKAHAEGLLDDEIIPFNGSREDNGVRGDSTIEKLSSLKPAFIRPHGTHTAANSSFLTDGASAALVMEEGAALDAGLTPKAVLRDWTFVSQDPSEELLLGPAYAMFKLLTENGLTLADIDVFELHEAFAGQVLANLAAIGSDKFANESAGVSGKLGEIPMEKMNTMGGSLSIGHPFGATGARLVTTTANRLAREDGTLGLVAACAAGGQGVAMLIERYAPAGSAGKGTKTAKAEA